MAEQKPKKAATILTPTQIRVLDWVAGERYFCQRFYFTGGTALAEFYLKHRLSEDLDFFSEEEVDIRVIEQKFQQDAKKLGVQKIDTRNVFGLWTFFLHFTTGEPLKVDFSYYPFTRIERGVRYKTLAVDSPYDIAVNKVHTIAMQSRARDFIDIYFLVKEYNYTLQDLLKQAKAKFDWDITAMQLGSQLLSAREATDFPRMLKPIKHKEWRAFFLAEAKRLGKEIVE